MRKSMKKIVSAVIATLTVATLTLTAFAVDYAAMPEYNATPAQTVSITTDELSDAVSNVEEGSAVSVSVESVGALTISPSVVKKIDETGTDLEIVSPQATISIDADTIEKVGKINLSMHIYGNKDRIVVKMRSKKDLGCEAKITLTDCKMSEEALANANLYCNGKKVGPVEVDENGYPVITVTEGGTYVIK